MMATQNGAGPSALERNLERIVIPPVLLEEDRQVLGPTGIGPGIDDLEVLFGGGGGMGRDHQVAARFDPLVALGLELGVDRGADALLDQGVLGRRSFGPGVRAVAREVGGGVMVRRDLGGNGGGDQDQGTSMSEPLGQGEGAIKKKTRSEPEKR